MNSKHPLLGKFDEDPGRWRPYWYGLKIDVPAQLDGRGAGSINLNNQPFIMTRMTHQIQGCTDPDIDNGLYQDGQYDIAWKDEQSNYQNGPLPAECFMGSVRSGFSYEFPYPIPYSGNKTLTFEIFNRCARIITGSDPIPYFKVAIVIHGIADWGTVLPIR